MKISQELHDRLADCFAIIRHLYDVKIGYMHPYGAFMGDDLDFVMIVVGDVDPDGEIVNCQHYFVEYNPFLHDTDGIFCRYSADLEQQNSNISDFLIDFHNWMKNGEIDWEYHVYKNWKWRDEGNGYYSVERKNGSERTSYMEVLDNFAQEDSELAGHIVSEKKKNRL